MSSRQIFFLVAGLALGGFGYLNKQYSMRQLAAQQTVAAAEAEQLADGGLSGMSEKFTFSPSSFHHSLTEKTRDGYRVTYNSNSSPDKIVVYVADGVVGRVSIVNGEPGTCTIKKYPERQK